MPIKQTTYICDVCGEKFTSKKQFEAHKCERPETLYLVSLDDYPGHNFPRAQVRKGRIGSCKGKLSFRYDDGEFMPVSVRPDEDVHGRVFLNDHAGIESDFTDDDVLREGCAMFIDDLKDLAGAVEKLYDFQRGICARRHEEETKRLEKSVGEEAGVAEQLRKVQAFVSAHIEDIVRLADEWNEPFQSTDAESWNVLPYRTKKHGTNELYLNGGVEEPEKGPEAEYDDDDWFVMKVNINWADEIDFECAEVITGKDRRELEERAAKAETCRLAFGTNERGDEDDIMSRLTFQRITQDEHDVLERIGMLSVGDIGYNDILEGLAGAEIDEDDDE